MPKTEKRITTFGQVVFIAFAVVVDATEFILNILLIGIILNPIISIIVTGIQAGYARSKGLGSESWKVYASIGGTTVGESIPGLSLLPFFTFNAWYITHAIKKIDKTNQKAVAEQGTASTAEQERQEWIANYQLQQQDEQMQEDDEQAEEQEENSQDEPEQKANWQNDGGAGRIAPLKLKMPPEPKRNVAEQRKVA